MFDRKTWQKKYTEEHREEIREYQKRWYQIPENKNRIKLRGKTIQKKEYNKLWQQANRESLMEYGKNYRRSPKGIERRKIYINSLKGKACRRRFFQSLRGKMLKKLYGAQREEKEKGLTLYIVQQVYEDNIKKYGTLTCYLCLQPIPFGKDSLEHKIPLSRGGDNARDNLDIACQSCNCKKFTKTEEEYRKELVK